MAARRFRVLLVSSSGGVLLDVLALETWWSRHDATWVAVRAPDTEERLAGMRVHWAPELSARRPWGLVASVLEAWRLVSSERPTAIVSAGTGVAIPYYVVARLRR